MGGGGRSYAAVVTPGMREEGLKSQEVCQAAAEDERTRRRANGAHKADGLPGSPANPPSCAAGRWVAPHFRGPPPFPTHFRVGWPAQAGAPTRPSKQRSWRGRMRPRAGGRPSERAPTDAVPGAELTRACARCPHWPSSLWAWCGQWCGRRAGTAAFRLAGRPSLVPPAQPWGQRPHRPRPGGHPPGPRSRPRLPRSL